MTTNNRRKLLTTFVLVLGALIATRLLFWLLPDIFDVWNDRATDQLFVLRSSWEALQPVYDNTVCHVDLNNSTIQKLKNYYLNRSHFATAVENLADMGVFAQVWDFIFAARLNEQIDSRFIEATREAGNAYFGIAMRLTEKGGGSEEKALPALERLLWHPIVKGDPKGFYIGSNPLLCFRELSSASRGLGCISVRFDQDGVLRRVPLLVRYGDGYVPFLAFRVICDYMRVSSEDIVIKPGKHILLKDAQRPGDVSSHDVAIPIDRHGNMVINYIGPWGRMDHYNLADVLSASENRFELEMWKEELHGKIVVISDVSTGSTDVGPVPTDSNFPLSGFHANIMHTILGESFLEELSKAQTLLIEGLMLFFVFTMSLRLSSVYFSLGAVLVAFTFLCAGCACFLYANVIIALVEPLIMVSIATGCILVYRYMTEEREKLESLRQRDFIRATFGRYLSNEVVEELLGSPKGLSMSGEVREVTFLVSDLRGFTSLADRLSPHEVINILNRYFERMIEVVGRYRGTVSEFRGDGMLVFFGAPLKSTNDAERAIACALDMQNELMGINQTHEGLHLPQLGMGIGVHTGDVVVGNIGSERRASYGAVGSPINTAFRIESYTVEGQVLISSKTYESVQHLVHTRDSLQVQFKGLEGRLTLYDVDALEGTYSVALTRHEEEELLELESFLPIRCFLVKEKTVSEAPMSGNLFRLSESSAEVMLQGELDLRTNVKVAFDLNTNRRLSEVYAKVLSVDQTTPGSESTLVRLNFTAIPDDTRSFFRQLLARAAEEKRTE